MKKIKLALAPSLFMFSALSSASEANLRLTKGMSGELTKSIDTVTIISSAGIPIKLNANEIRQQVIAQVGMKPINDLEIQVHDENNEIIITDRSRIIIHTDISELRQCCVNGVGPNTRSTY
jgi:hypothetical protein